MTNLAIIIWYIFQFPFANKILKPPPITKKHKAVKKHSILLIVIARSLARPASPIMARPIIPTVAATKVIKMLSSKTKKQSISHLEFDMTQLATKNIIIPKDEAVRLSI